VAITNLPCARAFKIEQSKLGTGVVGILKWLSRLSTTETLALTNFHSNTKLMGAQKAPFFLPTFLPENPLSQNLYISRKCCYLQEYKNIPRSIMSTLSLFDFTTHLTNLSKGLLFMSESDFPVEFITPPPTMKPQRSSAIVLHGVAG
jgi:hypothetical protein